MPVPARKLRAIGRRFMRRSIISDEKPSAVVEIDESFDGLESWLAWAQRNPAVFNNEAASVVARQILSAGFQEPLTGRIVPPGQISART